jgi:hypothetical protein
MWNARQSLGNRACHIEICKFLISANADVAAKNRCGCCLRRLQFSLSSSHVLVFSHGKTALDIAIDKSIDLAAYLRFDGAPQ